MADLLDALLRRGWLPRELPPCFTTSSFADFISSHDLPKERAQDVPDAEPCLHSVPRYRTLRRDLSIVNPRAQLGLSRELSTAWSTLEGHCRRSSFSRSTPTLQSDGRAVERAVPRTQLGAARALNRSGGRWLLKADIAQFYSSIYTHSIPWALHSKPVGKRSRSPNLLGNRLDAWVRKGQHGQTKGIPVGPDTSLVLAEVLLSSVDRQIATAKPGLRALRYMDDFEFVLESESEGATTQQLLDEALRKYELTTNPKKATFARLPQELQRPWATTLAEHARHLEEGLDETGLVGFFSSAFELATTFEDEPVLNFALARIHSMPQSDSRRVREVLDALLLQALVAEPGTHRYVLDHFTRQEPTDPLRLRQVLVEHVCENARVGHMNEVAWALWAIIRLNFKVGGAFAGRIDGIRNDVIALLALEGQRRGLIDDLDLTLWQSLITVGNLYGPHWLLTYESLHRGLLRASGGDNPVRNDVFFEALEQADVSFLNLPPAASVDSDSDWEDDADDDYLRHLLEPEAAWEDSYSP